MSKFLIVLNPNAGKGSGRRRREDIIRTLRSRTTDFEIVETTKPGDATEIARSSSSPTVVSVGGDGTTNEIANGLVGSDKALGVLPIGSGNDFVKSIGVPTHLESAVSILMSHKVVPIDLGHAEFNGGPGARYFVNGLGIGFDAAVAVRTHSITFLSGTLEYILAVIQTLGRYVAPEFEVTVDQRVTRSRDLLIAIGNGTCAGGGFYLTPEAKIADGKLDVCIVEEKTTMAILRLMPHVMKGNHKSVKGVIFDRGERITVKSDRPSAVHTDGEILGEAVSDLRVDVVPRALGVVVGPSFT